MSAGVDISDEEWLAGQWALVHAIPEVTLEAQGSGRQRESTMLGWLTDNLDPMFLALLAARNITDNHNMVPVDGKPRTFRGATEEEWLAQRKQKQEQKWQALKAQKKAKRAAEPKGKSGRPFTLTVAELLADIAAWRAENSTSNWPTLPELGDFINAKRPGKVTPPTVRRRADDAVEQGLLVKGERRRSGRGRQANIELVLVAAVTAPPSAVVSVAVFGDGPEIEI